MKKLIDLYPYLKQSDSDYRFLVMLRAKNKIYAGQWRMIGGKVKHNETSFEAALRELREETQLIPHHFWTIPSINSFYEAKTDQIHHIPAFAAEIKSSNEIHLDDEHTQYKWIKASDAHDYLAWPEQIRLMKLAEQLLLSDSIMSEWEISI